MAFLYSLFLNGISAEGTNIHCHCLCMKFLTVLFVLISQEQNLHPVRIYNKTKIFEMKEKVTLLCMGVYSECQVMQVNTEGCALTC